MGWMERTNHDAAQLKTSHAGARDGRLSLWRRCRVPPKRPLLRRGQAPLRNAATTKQIAPRMNIFLDDVNKLVHDKNASAAESKYRFNPYRNPYSHRNGISILFTGIRSKKLLLQIGMDISSGNATFCTRLLWKKESPTW